MLENKFSALRNEDAAITLPLLNSPSAGNEQNSTVDDVHNHPTVTFDFSNTILHLSQIYLQVIHLRRENYH
eukprot:3133524-Ditylum_brightwellii.AAC.1